MLKRFFLGSLAFFVCMTNFSVFLETKAEEAQQPKKIEIASIQAKSTANYPIENAIDGDKETYWQSPRSSQSVGVIEYKYDHNRYIDIQLDGTYALSSIKLYQKEGSYYHYYIYASTDGVNYNRIATKSDDQLANSDGDTLSLQGNASYLRLNMAYNSGEYTTNLKEIEVYGTKISTKVTEKEPISIETFADSEWSTKWEQFENNEVYAEQKTIQEIQGLVSRVIGAEYVDKFVFELRDSMNVQADGSGNDVFELESVDGKIVIRGNDGVSLASGFNYYLKYYCNVDYNPIYTSSDMTMPSTLPSIDRKIVKDTQYDYRYALNFCTYSYSMSFWGWDEYEAFLDWAAMNGINLMLDIVGQEEVLRQFLKTYGYTDEEVSDYISGPAYFAWFYMQNLDSFGGPLPQAWYEQRTELGRKLHDRMQAYGIDPVIQGFSGMVPYDFAEKANISANQVLDVGDWPGYKRPYMLRTHKSGINEVSDIYSEAAQRFYQAQKDVFGDVSNYYAVDPFHEGGTIPGDMNIQYVYYQVQEQMLKHDKGNDAIWVMQQWQGGISAGKLNGLKDKNKAIVLDLQSDMRSQAGPMENTGTPWIWNMLHNFGGRMGMDGEVEVIASAIPEAMNNSRYMVGIGITPEAIENSPIVYELLFDMTWQKDPINYKEWTYQYAQRRYNIDRNNQSVIDDINTAYDILLNTVYEDKDYYIQGAAESVVNARPGTSFSSASTWGHSTISYEKTELEKAVALFAAHYDELKGSPAFVYDFSELLEQVLSNTAVEYHKLMVQAYQNKDAQEFDRISAHFLDLIALSDEVLSTSEKFMLGTWIENARTMLDSDTYQMDDWSRDLFEFNARALLTTWGAAKNGSLKDYSNRKWSGLTEDFYLQRWTIWVNNRKAELAGAQATNPNWFLWEWKWANQKNDDGKFGTTPDTTVNLKSISEDIMENYSMTNIENFVAGGAMEEDENIAIDKPVEANFAPSSGSTSNLVDNNTGSGYIYDKTSDNVIMEMDLNGIARISQFALAFNQGAGKKPYHYKIEYLDPETSHWVQVKLDNSGALEANEIIPFECTASKIRYTFKTLDLANNPIEINELFVYGKMIKEYEFINYALGMPVTTDGNPERPATNVTDGRLDTIWVENNGVFGETTNVIVDLETKRTIEFIEICFESAGRPFQYKVLGNDGSNDTWTMILDNSNSQDATPAKVSIPYNQPVQKIKVVMTGKNSAGSFPGSWPAIAEVRALAQKRNDTVEFSKGENVALNKPVTVPANDADKGLIVDGIHNGSSNRWEQKSGNYPSEIIVDLEGTYYLDEVLAGMEGAGYGFKYKLEIINKSGERVMIADRSADGEVAGDDRYIHIPVEDYAQKVIYTLTGAGVGQAQLAWPCLSELQAITGKPDTLSVNATITSDGYTGLEALKDDDTSTFVQFDQAGNKEIHYTLKRSQDIDCLEIVKTAGSALKYKAYYKNTSGDWIEFADMSNNDKDKMSNTYMFDHIISAQEYKFVIFNDNVTISDINLFTGQATGPLKLAISSAKATLASKTIGDYANNYPQSAADALQAAIDAAQQQVDAKISAAQVTIELQKLKAAVQEFEKSGPIEIDRKVLNAVVSDAEIFMAALTKTNNVDLIAVLENKYQTAKTMKDTYQVTQVQVDTATNELNAVIEANKDVFNAILDYQKTIEKANKQLSNTTIGDKDGNVPQSAADALTQAVSTAQSDYMASSNHVETIVTITNTLQAALETFQNAQVKVDKQALKVAIILAKTKTKDDYTSSSWTSFSKVYNNAMKIDSGSNVSVKEVEDATKALSDAINSLTKRGNTAELEALAFEHDNKAFDETLVTLDSYQAYQDALDDAKAIINQSANASQDDLDNAYDALNSAYEDMIGSEKSIQKLSDVITALDVLHEDHYTKASWNALQTAVEEAQALIDSGAPKYFALVKAEEAITKAKNELVEVSDNSALQDKIDELTSFNLVENDYTADSWKAYSDKLQEANELVNNDSATAEEIAAMVTALDEVYQALVVDKSALQALVDDQDDLIEANYTPESWTVLQTALEQANAALQKSDLSAAEMNEALNDLQTAIDQLVSSANTGALQKLVEKINKEQMKADDYTEATWNTFADALAKANEVLEKADPTTVEITEAQTALQDAYDALRATLKPLEDKLKEHAALKEDDYTSDSWSAYQSAKTDAQAVLDKGEGNVTYAELKQAMDAYNQAFGQLQKLFDPSDLQVIIDDYAKENLKESEYNAITWQNYETALNHASDCLQDINATGKQLLEAKEALMDAHDALISIKDLKALMDQVDTMEETTYTTSTWAQLLQVKTDVRVHLTQATTKEQVAKAQSDLQQAIDALTERSDNTTLQAQIDAYDNDSALVETNFTAASWSDFQTAYQAVQAILNDNSNVDQATADAALQTLIDAYDALELSGNGYLLMQIAKVEAMADDQDLYTSSTWQALQNALVSAKEIASDPSSTDADFTKAHEDLTKAEAALERRGDASELRKKLEEMKAYDPSEFTDESWEIFEPIWEQAKAIAADIDATQNMIDEILEQLVEANQQLVAYHVDKTKLGEAIDEASAKKESDYTSATWKLFQKKLQAANDIMATAKPEQSSIDQAEKDLRDAMKQLVKRGDKTQLTTLIQTIEQLDEARYTSDSWSALQKAYEQALSIYDDIDASEVIVKDGEMNLTKALEALQEKGDKTALQSYVETVKALKQSDYTIETWSKFATALEYAESVLSSENATQKEINDAADQLKRTYDQLKKVFQAKEELTINDAPFHVSLEASASVVDPLVELVVELVEDAKAKETFAQIFKEDTKDYIVFDISLLLNGQKIQPNGMVKIRMDIPKGYDVDRIQLFYINDRGERQVIKHTIENNQIVFETDHFSYYAIAQMKEDMIQKQPNKGISSSIVNTSDSTNLIGWGMMFMAFGCLSIGIWKKRYQ